MTKSRWYDPTPREREMVEEAAPSGGSFPDFTGSGSPEGVITADPGKTYVDTTNGGLYFKHAGSGSTGWYGFANVNGGLTVTGPASGNIVLSDVLSQGSSGSGNGVYWTADGVDGEQRFKIELGPNNTFETAFNADGTTEFPGPITGPTGLLPIADRTGVTVETVTPDSINNSGSMDVLTFPHDAAAIAIKLAGDAFPRWILAADGTNGIYLGDGTAEPNNVGGNIWYFGRRLHLDGADGIKIGDTIADGDIVWVRASNGPVVHDDADGHTYRIGSHNGTATLTQVT